MIQCLLPFFAAALFSAFFVKKIISFLQFPAKGAIGKLAFFTPQEVVLVYLKAAIITLTTGPFNMFLLAIPMFILYEISIWVSSLTEFKRKV